MAAGIVHRLRYTPLSDLLRGRVTGRLDVRGHIAASSLPAAAKDLVWRVVKRTRLWPAEKVEVADELLAHFADGWEAGTSVEELIRAFGDEKSAAKLIRRAKKRNRPLPWHILRTLGWFVAALLAIYAVLAVRFVAGHPSPKVDYVQVLNKPQLAVPPEQRAWPIYREAIILLGDRDSKQAEETLIKVLDARLGGKDWAFAGQWLHEHAKIIELTRQASEKPALGFILGSDGSMNDASLYPGLSGRVANSSAPGAGSIIAVLLPHMNDLRILANLLATDARFAREQGDIPRVMRDIKALVRLAEQAHGNGQFLVIEMWSMAIWSVALEVADQTLLQSSDKLSDSDLVELAHLLSKPRLASDLLSLASERVLFHDMIQRTYTDDGSGDGHLTLEGHKFLRIIGAYQRARGEDQALAQFVESALTPALTISRREAKERVDRVIDIADANLRQPIREADWMSYDQQLDENAGSFARTRLGPLPSFGLNGLKNTQIIAERWLGQRDGIVTAVAFELYRRQHKQYPSSLDALVPQYLPAVTADRINGEPLRFRIVDGRPLIYSVGVDGDDDGGRVPLSGSGKPHSSLAADWSHPSKVPDGDWVLYPQPKEDE